MASDKFTKDFSDFGAYTRPGMIYPNMFDHLPSDKGGDSQPGLQYMTQLALSAYGEYHVIDDCVPTIDGTDITGTVGYVMITGNIVEVDIELKTTLSEGYYLIIESDGGYATTGDKPTGVIIAENIGGTIYNISRRESNSINYFPTGVVFYGETYHYENIIMNSYDIRGASGITGDTITGGQIIGTQITGTTMKMLGTLNMNSQAITNANSLSVNNNITVGGTVDGIDVSAIKLNSMPSAANGDIDCNTQAITNVGNIDGIDVSAISLNSMPTVCGGDVDINNHGINNIDNLDERVYYVSTDAELDNAISDITTNACAGRIIITDSLSNVQVTINAVNSSFIIGGNGDKTVLDANGDNSVFTITNCKSCVLRDFKIDATDLTTAGKAIIGVDEANNNKVTIDNITIVGDGTNGYGVRIDSNNCIVRNCDISSVSEGIYIPGINCIIADNLCYSMNFDGIVVSNYTGNNTVTGNVCHTNGRSGIYLTGGKNTVSGNNCYNNTQNGIYIHGGYNIVTGNNYRENSMDGIYVGSASYNTISGNNCCDNDSNTTVGRAGIRIEGTSKKNTVSGNNCCDNNNIGTGTGYGICLEGGIDCDENTVVGNTALGNDTNFSDSGENTFGDATLNNFA